MQNWRNVVNMQVFKTLTFKKGAVMKVTDNLGAIKTIDVSELSPLDGLTATVAELNQLDASLASNSLTPGSGITGTGTVYKSGISKSGDIITTRIFIDLTGLNSGGTAADIIGGNAAANSHFGQITAAKSGTIVGGKMVCLEAPATGCLDIDLWTATEATGAEDAAVTALTETAVIDAGGAWTNGMVKGFTGEVAANQYLYLASSGTQADGTYSAGKFLIELYGV